MEIQEIEEPRKVKLKELFAGEVFSQRGILCMVVQKFTPDNDEINLQIADISDGELTEFRGEQEVLHYPNARICLFG